MQMNGARNFGALAALAAEADKPSRMVIVNHDGAVLRDSDKDCYIEFLSSDSEPGRKFDRARATAQVRKMRSGRNVLDDVDLIEVQAEKLAVLATDWYLGEGAEAFSREAARELFVDPEFGWLRQQAWGFVEAPANFQRGSSKNSSPSPSTNSETRAS